MKLHLIVSLALGTTVASAWGSGFGLYEASAPTYALGGSVIGRAVDASANFFNPATLTDLTNATVTLGFMTEHPRGRMKSNVPGGRTTTMDPGCFLLPHLHTAVPLPYDLAFGLGLMPEYGLGSEYVHDWDLSFNSLETTVTSFTLNPNLAWRASERFSLGGGFRVLYFDFEQKSRPCAASLYGQDAYFRNRLKGNNGMSDFGYQLGFKYDVRDDLALGLVYKSMTRVHVKGRSQNRTVTELEPLFAAARAASGDARTTLDLPQSVTAGVNWDITDDWHLGASVAWTEWSKVGTLNFHLPGQIKRIKLDWDDTWRFGLAPSWDFAENWTWLASYVFETDCCGHQDSTMLPPSERHMISTGLLWRFSANLDVALTYGMILMDGAGSDCTRMVGAVRDGTYRYGAHRAISHATGVTVTWRF